MGKTQKRRQDAHERQVNDLAWKMINSPRKPNCSNDQGWREIEKNLHDALHRNSRREARMHAADLVPTCTGCPVRKWCRQWAELDHYTGVAGGSVIHNGKPLAADSGAN